jgi:hypothetical protein
MAWGAGQTDHHRSLGQIVRSGQRSRFRDSTLPGFRLLSIGASVERLARGEPCTQVRDESKPQSKKGLRVKSKST